VNKLCDNDKVRRLQFPTWAAAEHEILFNIRCSDKICFHLDGILSKWNMQFWRMEPTEHFHGKSSHRGKVTALVAMSIHSLIGPIYVIFACTAEQLLATTDSK